MREIIPGAASGSSAVCPNNVWPFWTVSRFVPSLSIWASSPACEEDGEAEDGDDRRHADRDPERRQRRAHPARAQADARDTGEVGEREPAA